MITTVCKISYGSQTVPPIVPAVQGDTGRAISFEIADFTPPAGATATYFILKPSGEAVYNSATITDNSILCELTAQSLAEKGENRMQVRVLQGDDIVTSFEVILMVRPFLGDDAIESGTEMDIFDQAVAQATEQFQENAEQIVEEVIEAIPADYTELTEEVEQLNERMLLFDDNVPNTVQTYTFTNGSVSKVEHKSGNILIRSDVFTYGEDTITEMRTLNTGESLIITTDLTTLETTVKSYEKAFSITNIIAGIGAYHTTGYAHEANAQFANANISSYTFNEGDIVKLEDPQQRYGFTIGTNDPNTSSDGNWNVRATSSDDYEVEASHIQDLKCINVKKVDGSDMTSEDISYLNTVFNVYRLES